MSLQLLSFKENCSNKKIVATVAPSVIRKIANLGICVHVKNYSSQWAHFNQLIAGLLNRHEKN
jgi:hypothetical protein